MLNALCVSMLCMAVAGQDAPAGNPDQEALWAFGGGLKAAVQSGVMSREEAWSLWEAASLVYQMDNPEARKSADGKAEGKDERDVQATAWYRARRLSPPRAREVRQVLEPEFLTRDALLLQSSLDLEEEQALIVDMVLKDYADTFDALTAPLTDALARWREAERARDLQAAMQRLDGSFELGGVDLDAAAEAFLERGNRSEQRRARGGEAPAGKDGGAEEEAGAKAQEARQKQQARRARQAEQLIAMDNHLAALRERMQGRLEIVESAGDLATAADVSRLLEHVASQRALLRKDVEEMIQAVVVLDDVERQGSRLERVLAVLEVGRPATQARFGGEHIPLEQVLSQVFHDTVPAEAADGADGSLMERAELIRARRDAAIARELEGWRFMIEREAIIAVHRKDANVEIDVWVRALAPFGAAWHRQLDASRAVRDCTLEQVDLIEQVLRARQDAMAGRWREAAMRRGFSLEMRPRWVERALDAALALEDLTPDQVQALVELEADVSLELQAIRDRAIERRIQRDPEVAASPMESFWGDRDKVERPWSKEDWAGFEFEAHDALEERTQTSLASLLSADQLALLPHRRDGQSGRGEGGRRGAGKKDAGTGAGGKGAGGKGAGGKGAGGKGAGGK